MKPPRPLLRWVALTLGALLLFLGLGVVGYRWARNDALATLVEFSGAPERDTAQSLNQWRAAHSGDRFEAGDGARTAPDSVAYFRLAGGARLKLNAASQLRFVRHGSAGKVNVDVELGAADIQNAATAFTLESEFGPIAIDANSRLRLRRAGGQLAVEVELGSITLNEKKVAAGEQVTLELGGMVLDAPVAAPATSSAPPASAPTPSAEPAPAPLQSGNGVASADLVAVPGDSFVVHDPNPPSSVGFDLSKVCDGPARLSSGAQATEALGQANLRFERGKHRYEVRCLNEPGKVAARGTLSVLLDSGNRTLPTFTPSATVALDGRDYTVLYQQRLPKVTVTWPSAPAASQFTLTIGGRKISTSAPTHTFSSLASGRHKLTFTSATTPVRQSRTTTIEVAYDEQAPAAQLSDSPLAAGDNELTVRGNALPGWSVALAGKPLEVDATRAFSATVPENTTVPFVFSHPSHGTHYYLRRPKAAP